MEIRGPLKAGANPGSFDPNDYHHTPTAYPDNSNDIGSQFSVWVSVGYAGSPPGKVDCELIWEEMDHTPGAPVRLPDREWHSQFEPSERVLNSMSLVGRRELLDKVARDKTRWSEFVSPGQCRGLPGVSTRIEREYVIEDNPAIINARLASRAEMHMDIRIHVKDDERCSARAMGEPLAGEPLLPRVSLPLGAIVLPAVRPPCWAYIRVFINVRSGKAVRNLLAWTGFANNARGQIWEAWDFK